VRAAVLHAPGPPTAFSLEEIPVPEVSADDVLVKVAACGVSSKDVVERNGTYRRDMAFPIVIGMEISGTIVACGSDVHDLAVGDMICTKAFSSCGRCRFCRNGNESTCQRRRPVRGGYGEFSAIPADACVPVPPGIPFEVACTLGPAAGVALNAIRDTAGVKLGEAVLVTGATGGVGSPALQLAKRAGARTITITRSEHKRAILLEDGADEVVVAEEGQDFSKAVRALTDNQGVDVVIDTVGSRVFKACFDSLALHGRYAMVGQLTGEEISINPARIFFKRAHLLGVGSVSRTQVEDAAKLVARGLLKPRIGRMLPLDEIALAHQLVESGEVSGRVAIMHHGPK
jgi:acryloyl-coenzyme A reductase